MDPSQQIEELLPYLTPEEIQQLQQCLDPEYQPESISVQREPELNLSQFAHKYLSHHFPTPFGEHHLDLFDAVERPLRPGEKRKLVTRVEPREHGKSTIMTILVPIWWLAYKMKWYIILFGGSHSNIFPHYSTFQAELDPLTGNQQLLEDFPHLVPAMDFKKQFVSWTDYRSRFSSGATLVCLGIFSKFRGMKEGKFRPDAIILDDPQDEDDVSTPTRRERLLNRFRKTIMNLGGINCDLFVEGNLMHKESLVATLLQDEEWDRKLYRAENLPPDENEMFPVGNTKGDGSPLWPEAWSTERLQAKKREIKNRAYAIEFLNKLRGDDEVIYDSSEFKYFNPATINSTGEYTFILIWDPAEGRSLHSTRTDFASLTVIATKIGNNKDDFKKRYYWVFDNWLKKERAENQVEMALNFCTQYPVKRLIFEDNGGYGNIMPYLRRRAKERNIALNIKRVTQVKNKIQRIMNMQAVILHHTFFSERINSLYFNQWDDFPGADHEDGPDSTVTGIEQYEVKTGGFAF